MPRPVIPLTIDITILGDDTRLACLETDYTSLLAAAVSTTVHPPSIRALFVAFVVPQPLSASSTMTSNNPFNLSSADHPPYAAVE